ncbi:dihydrofolate reductase [Nisaea sp.]|uniref:dihydrofolate reductase n=1 Tax=Nisaea sp. TaxID=2024842 RepID=UPI00329979ED
MSIEDKVVQFPVPVIVVAVSDNGVIGDGEKMPWYLPADLKRVKRMTMGKPLVMGRKTYQSIGKPLPGRTNIVVTRERGFKAEGIEVVHDLDEALDLARRVSLTDGVDEIIVFGGAEIYRQAFDKVKRLHLTEIHIDAEGQTRFPDFDRAEWHETEREDHPAEGDTPAHSFVTLERG